MASMDMRDHYRGKKTVNLTFKLFSLWQAVLDQSREDPANWSTFSQKYWEYGASCNNMLVFVSLVACGYVQ